MPEQRNYVPDWLARRAADKPDGTALIAGSGPGAARWTYRELDARAEHLARAVAARGIAAGDRVAALLANGPAYVEAVHALIRLRAILVPLNLRLATAELAWQLGHSGARLLICDDSTAEQAEAHGDVPCLRLPIRVPGGDGYVATGDGDSAVPVQPRDDAAAASELSRPRTNGQAPAPDALLDLDAVHCIIYTSGTTGRPKGTLLTYGNHWWSAIGSALNLGLRADDRWLACLPFFHIGGLAILLRAAIYGIPVVLPDAGPARRGDGSEKWHAGPVATPLPPRPSHFDALAVNRALDEEAVTIVSMVSAMLPRLFGARGERPYPPTLRCLLLGGGPAPRALLEECARRGIPVTQTYGMTETCSQFATLAPADALRKLGAAGRPLLPHELRIAPLADAAREHTGISSGGEKPAAAATADDRDPAGRVDRMRNGLSDHAGGATGPSDTLPYRDGEKSPFSLPRREGEILVRGPSVTPGYLPESGDISALQPAADTDGWLHTGDIGYLDDEGFLYVLDRRSDLIISGGENIYPAEVEAVLLAHPAVAEAGVYAIDDERWGQRVAAAVVSRPGSAADVAAILSFCRERLAAYKVPAAIRIAEALPRNAAGKLLRRELRDI